MHISIPGSSPFSGFRRQRIARQLNVEDIQAQFIHFVNLDDPQAHDTEGREAVSIIEELLTYGDGLNDDILSGVGPEEDVLYVYPRHGTISPWSSLATAITHVCIPRHVGNLQRVERGIVVKISHSGHQYDMSLAKNLLHDRMTQTLTRTHPDLELMFAQNTPAPVEYVRLSSEGTDPHEVLRRANRELGLALDEPEIDYLIKIYGPGGQVARDPTDVELFMFSQINSEHCRHKQFNASWTIDGLEKPHTLFSMIRNTHEISPEYTLSAYSDNAAVFAGQRGTFLAPDRLSGEWRQIPEDVPYLGKVETHNHPSSVVPYEGAATGSGGEIRDEGAVGRGSRSKSGLCGFAVSNLLIPELQQPWELPDVGYPGHIAPSLKIMLEAPIGSAAYNNEYGRPCLCGYFRTLLTKLPVGKGKEEIRGYHKPIMLAGGIGTVRPQHALKNPDLVRSGAYILVMGGPAMLIGLGGGAASSQVSAEETAHLDFASVQRGNAEIERRAQDVINVCCAMGTENPIQFIHDVGAGGLSNALPELLHDTNTGAEFELREIANADRGMSPMQIWCNEAQERYVLAIDEKGINVFKAIADRERCGYSVVGRAERKPGTKRRLVLTDRESKEHPRPIDLSLSILFGKPPKLQRAVQSRTIKLPAFDNSLATYLPKARETILEEAAFRVLQLPAVASKMFLITIGDRTVGGLTCRDQLVGRWQTPVADCSVTGTSLTAGLKSGEAMAMGERPLLALINPGASARVAVAEALTNIAAADILGRLDRIRLSANWMTAINEPGEAAAIYEAVEAIGVSLCPELGISIPVGKDSTSMKMAWKDPKAGEAKTVVAPLSLNVTAFAPVTNTCNTWTPALSRAGEAGVGDTILLMVDLAEGQRAMGGSALAQVFGQIGNEGPDVRNVQLLKDYFDAIEQLHEAGIVLAYHDISDGGLFTTLAEMAIAGRCGINVMLDSICRSKDMSVIIPALFSEELGAVFQVRKSDEINFHRCFATCGPPRGLITKIGQVSEPFSSSQYDFAIFHGMDVVFRRPVSALHQTWSSTSYNMSKLRDNPSCAESESQSMLDNQDPGLSYNLTFKPKDTVLPVMANFSDRLSLTGLKLTSKPRVAILREQGINGQSEMAFAFMNAGFSAIDVHMTDLISGRETLSNFVGLAACGGFSYGDVLGAGQGWAKSVLFNKGLRQQFADFFARPKTFSLGVCNGCQFLSRLKSLIPGTEAWPSFQRNTSEQYEARFSMVEILDDSKSPSVFLHGMKGTMMPIAVSHGEGRAHFKDAHSQEHGAQALLDADQVSIRFVDNYLKPTETYPANPNGSPLGIAGVKSKDGRVLAMMPHPERCVLNPGSWVPTGAQEEWGDFGPWIRVFQSARRWIG